MIEIFSENIELSETEKDFYTRRLEKILENLPQKGDIGIRIGTKEEALELNVKYLKRDYPADVLSFPFDETLPDGYYLGDIFICYPVAQEQAEEYHISIKEELFTLMVHGVLHLAGYDHETDDGEMEKLQEELVNSYFSHTDSDNDE